MRNRVSSWHSGVHTVRPLCRFFSASFATHMNPACSHHVPTDTGWDRRSTTSVPLSNSIDCFCTTTTWASAPTIGAHVWAIDDPRLPIPVLPSRVEHVAVKDSRFEPSFDYRQRPHQTTRRCPARMRYPDVWISTYRQLPSWWRTPCSGFLENRFKKNQKCFATCFPCHRVAVQSWRERATKVPFKSIEPARTISSSC